MFDTSNLESFVTSASFTVDDGEVPVTIANPPGNSGDQRKGAVAEHEITVHDVRSIADQFDMDREGFAFMNCTSEMKDFFDEEEGRSVYYPEMENLYLQALSARKSPRQQERLEIFGQVLSMLQWTLRGYGYLPADYSSTLTLSDDEIDNLLENQRDASPNPQWY